MNYSEYLNKVGLTVNTLLSPFNNTNYGSRGSRLFDGRLGNKIEAVVLHTTGNTASAKNEATNIHNNKPVGAGSSFHAVVDKDGVYECVLFKNAAYHAGNKEKNLKTLGFELVDNKPSEGYDNYIKYVAWAMHQEGIVPTLETVLFHNEIVPTSCGSFLRNKGKAQIIADLNKYIAIAKSSNGVVAPKPTPKPQPNPVAPKPSTTQVAQEVINGAWGNDPQRSQKLASAGYNAKSVQDEVNRILGATSQPTPPIQVPIRKGDSVQIKGTATHYATGQAIPREYRGHKDTVLQVVNGKVLLKGLYSWVYTKDVQRV